jgi:peptide deformylase
VDKIITDKKTLRQKSRETSWAEIKELDLTKRLRDANKTAWTPGCGLAAIQIGVPVRYAWFIHKGKEYHLLNPEIIQRWGSEKTVEGCLSIPNKWTPVTRSVTISYTSNGKKKKAWGFLARIIQHEIDHMDGILNIDKGE